MEFSLALELEITDDILEKNELLKKYADFIADCAGIAGRYETHKREYDEFQTNSEFYRYLDGFTPGSEMVPSNFDQLSARINKIDKAAYTQITSDIQDFFDRYDSVMSWTIDQFDQVRMYLGDGVYRMYRDIKSGDQDLEDVLADLQECISTDVYYREADAIADIQREINSLDDRITRAYDIIARHALGKFDAMDDDYRAVKALSGGTYDALLLGMYGKLDYMNKPEFLMKSEMWPSYIGTSAAYDPYYNLKNQTHPSYQTHQFPWRFIKYTSHMQSDLEKLFIGAYLQDLTPESIANRIDGYIGEFG